MISLPVWLPGPMFLLVSLCPWSHIPSGGICLLGGGGLPPRGGWADPSPRTRKVGSTHPIGMLSYLSHVVL